MMFEDINKQIENLNKSCEATDSVGVSIIDCIAKNKKHSVKEWLDLFQEHNIDTTSHFLSVLCMYGTDHSDIELHKKRSFDLNYPLCQINFTETAIDYVPVLDQDRNIVFEEQGENIVPKMQAVVTARDWVTYIDNIEIVKKSKLFDKIAKLKE